MTVVAVTVVTETVGTVMVVMVVMVVIKVKWGCNYFFTLFSQLWVDNREALIHKVKRLTIKIL